MLRKFILLAAAALAVAGSALAQRGDGRGDRDNRGGWNDNRGGDRDGRGAWNNGGRGDWDRDRDRDWNRGGRGNDWDRDWDRGRDWDRDWGRHRDWDDDRWSFSFSLGSSLYDPFYSSPGYLIPPSPGWNAWGLAPYECRWDREIGYWYNRPAELEVRRCADGRGNVYVVQGSQRLARYR